MRLFSVALCALFLFGCASMKIDYPYSLKDSGTRKISNDRYEIAPEFEALQITLTVHNKMDSSLKILLDESSFVAPDGKQHRLIAGRTQTINASNAQVPIVIPKKMTVTSTLVSQELRVENYVVVGGELLPFNPHAHKYIGREFTLLLVLQDANNKKYEETMTFKIDGPAPSRTTSSVGPGK